MDIEINNKKIIWIPQDILNLIYNFYTPFHLILKYRDVNKDIKRYDKYINYSIYFLCKNNINIKRFLYTLDAKVHLQKYLIRNQLDIISLYKYNYNYLHDYIPIYYKDSVYVRKQYQDNIYGCILTWKEFSIIENNKFDLDYDKYVEEHK